MMVKNQLASAPTELCKKLSYDPGAMTRLIDRLEEKGLVRRLRAEDDRRAQRLELTREGEALYPKIVAALVKVYNQLLRGFNKTEVNQLQDMLKRMLDNA
jgi:DNA-binding MarR family transcriptional regulator